MIIVASVETSQYQVWCVNICRYIAHYPKMIFMFVCFAFIKMKNEVLYFYLDLYDDEARSSITVKQCHQANTICIVPTHLSSETFLVPEYLHLFSFRISLHFAYFTILRQKKGGSLTLYVYFSLVCMCMSMCI